jgi:hypothetical protein
MRVVKTTIACMVLTFVVVSIMAMAQSSKLEGVWKLEADPSSGAATKAFPSLFILSKRYYSQMYVPPDRPMLPENPTDAQRLAALRGVTANAGTYEVNGTTITIHPTVALSPNVMAPGTFQTYEFRIEGNMLTVTTKANQNGPVVNPPTFKLVRLE